MPGRLPTADDGLPGEYAIVPPPQGQPPTNILLLFHGLGDSHVPFESFGAKLQLPETACLALSGPAPMPFDIPGAHWGDDIVFDERSGGIDADTGFERGTRIVLEVIHKVLVGKCGYTLREISLFGFGQGGMLALGVAAELEVKEELSGVVSVGGALPARAPVPEVGRKSGTPILVCKGYRQSAVKDADEDRLRDCFEFVQVKEWQKSGDGMPASREEMLPIMQFWARRLRSRRGVPTDSIELT